MHEEEIMAKYKYNWGIFVPTIGEFFIPDVLYVNLIFKEYVDVKILSNFNLKDLQGINSESSDSNDPIDLENENKVVNYEDEDSPKSKGIPRHGRWKWIRF